MNDDAAARYVAGTLEADELEELELHLLTCGDCRDAVGEAAAIHGALRRRRRVRRTAAVSVGGTAAAAVIAWLILAPSQIEKLGRVDAAPVASLMEVRAGPDSAAPWTRMGTDAYRSGDYKGAANNLARAYTHDPQPGTGFFLGVSLLMTGKADSAIIVFRNVAESSSVYAQEANFYAAKAWLQLSKPDSALARLRGTNSALQDSIRRAM